MISTVLLNDDSVDSSADVSDVLVGEPVRVRREMGELVSDVVGLESTGDDEDGGGRRRASDAARRSRLVVPKALVEPERAEQTIASLCRSK